MAVGDYLANLMHDQGIRQKELAEAAGVSASQISRLLNGQITELPLQSLPAIERRLGITVGTCLRLAGYVEAEVDVGDSILGDPQLSPGYKRQLHGLWRTFIAAEGGSAPS